MTQRCIHRKGIFDAYRGEKIDVKHAQRCLFLCSWCSSGAVEGTRGSLRNPQERYKVAVRDLVCSWEMSSAEHWRGQHCFTSWETGNRGTTYLQCGRSRCKSNICQIEMLDSYLLMGCHDQLLWDNIHLLRWRFSQFCTISRMLLRSQRAL